MTDCRSNIIKDQIEKALSSSPIERHRLQLSCYGFLSLIDYGENGSIIERVYLLHEDDKPQVSGYYAPGRKIRFSDGGKPEIITPDVDDQRLLGFQNQPTLVVKGGIDLLADPDLYFTGPKNNRRRRFKDRPFVGQLKKKQRFLERGQNVLPPQG